MRIFLAGATGAVGKQLVPALLSAGHHVTGMTRTAAKASALSAAGAEPVIADALDRGAVMAAVARARPDVVIHQVTALSALRNLRNFDREFALTNRLRTEGTDHLLAAAQAAGARQFVAQSFTGWPNRREGGRVKTEEDPLDPDPPPAMRRSLDAIRQLEAKLSNARGLTAIVLRYGSFYGPGTSIAQDGDIVEMVRRRKFPLFGNGAGVWSFLHIKDAANAALRAVERGLGGTYNIVDDEPAEVALWLPFLAQAVGAPPPVHLPAWLGRILLGEVGLSMMTRIRASSNAAARRALGWHPAYSTWREGFRTGL
jgi:nucleoside-diphosphate-sugar epimerase